MSKLRTAIIQLIVGIGLLFTLELAARVFDEGQPSTSMDLNLTYTMFSMPPGETVDMYGKIYLPIRKFLQH